MFSLSGCFHTEFSVYVCILCEGTPWETPQMAVGKECKVLSSRASVGQEKPVADALTFNGKCAGVGATLWRLVPKCLPKGYPNITPLRFRDSWFNGSQSGS